MTKASNIPAIEKATNKSWQEWLTLLSSFDADQLEHHNITKKLHELTDVDGWWIQAVTVAYEQHIGRRQPGQVKDGSFETSASKTVMGDMSDVMVKWIDVVGRQADFDGVKLVSSSSSETEKWRNWRGNLADDSKVIVGIYQKSPEKSVLGLAHQKLPSTKTAEHWNAYWKAFLKALN